jgi:general secretion pathway protein F/type IV pilus assembly protein PilC
MPLYHFQALEPSGKKRKGFIEAIDERDAKLKLKEQGIFLTRLETKGALKSNQNLKGEELENFTMLLSQLISSGIPLYESLIALEEQMRESKAHRILLSLAEQVKGGNSLSQSMSTFPDSFDPLYTAMVSAGESGGHLSDALEKLNGLLQKKAKLKKELTTAMIYPLILGGFALIVIIVMLTFVIPSVEGIFAAGQLNRFTQFVINVSRFVRENYWIYLPLMGLLGVLGYYQLKKPKVKEWMFNQLMKLPLIGMIMIQAAGARYCRTLANLLLGGVPLIEAMRLARATLQNPLIEEEMVRYEGRIIEGSHLSFELSQSQYIPKIASRMVAIGEESGSLAPMLNKVADIFEEELDKKIKRALALTQPLILLFMGLIIGLILIAVLLPLTDLSHLSQ